MRTTTITTLAELKAHEGEGITDQARRARRRVIRSGGTVTLPVSAASEGVVNGFQH